MLGREVEAKVERYDEEVELTTNSTELGDVDQGMFSDGALLGETVELLRVVEGRAGDVVVVIDKKELVDEDEELLAELSELNDEVELLDGRLTLEVDLTIGEERPDDVVELVELEVLDGSMALDRENDDDVRVVEVSDGVDLLDEGMTVERIILVLVVLQTGIVELLEDDGPPNDGRAEDGESLNREVAVDAELGTVLVNDAPLSLLSDIVELMQVLVLTRDCAVAAADRVEEL